MKFLIGKKEDFTKFVDSIKESDSVAILTHNDLDGLANAFFLEKILGSKKIKIDCLEFVFLSGNDIEMAVNKVKIENYKKVFLTDLNLDENKDIYDDLRKNRDVLLIDHHVVNPNIKDTKNMLKLRHADCIAYVMFELAKDYIDVSEWTSLVCSTMISEYSFKDPDQVDYIKKYYPDFSIDNIYETEIGLLTRVYNNVLVYFYKNEKKAYELIKDNNMEEMKKISEIVEKEIVKYVKLFKTKAEYYKDKDLYFYYLNPKYRVTSIIINRVSDRLPNSSLVFVSDLPNQKDMVKISARNQNEKQDMNKLMKKGIAGLKNAIGGGHVPAAGGNIRKKDLNKFKQNLLK